MEEKEKKEKRERILWNEELIRKVIADNGYTTIKQLRDAHGGAYQFLKRKKLEYSSFGLDKRGIDYTMEDVNELIRDGGLRSMRELKKANPSMYSWVYNNHRQDEVVFPLGRRGPAERNEYCVREKRYDIWKVMHLLSRYAKEEGISLRDSAVKYGYFYEWYDLVREGKAPTEE